MRTRSISSFVLLFVLRFLTAWIQVMPSFVFVIGIESPRIDIEYESKIEFNERNSMRFKTRYEKQE